MTQLCFELITKKKTESTIRCKMVTDRLNLFQNYLRAYRYRLYCFGINYRVTDTDLALLIP